MLSACARTMDSNTVNSSTSVGKVIYGTVVSARGVTIKDNDRLGDNVLGGAAGGVMGGIGGSTIGSGSGRTAATAGGAIAGAVLGAYIQDQLSTSSGFEYIVKLDAPKTPKLVTNRSNDNLRIGTNNRNEVEREVMASAIPEETASDAISVVQQDDAAIAPGTRVMVIYRDDRARIVPAY
jgi:outer membrane lipoprotein SlyB